jgi:hypothetical protein
MTTDDQFAFAKLGETEASAPRRFQCITIDAESVIVNGRDFDAMVSEITRLRGQLDAAEQHVRILQGQVQSLRPADDVGAEPK